MILAAGVLAAGIWVLWNRPAAGQAQERQATWEYAVYYDGDRSAWSGPDRELWNQTAYELYQHLGGEKREEQFRRRSVDTFNLVGEAGWELLAVHNNRGLYAYYFKRPAR
jgi:hypothetical protein